MMMRRFARTLAILLALALSWSTFGEAGQKSTHVKAYTKKDGTTVAAHERKAPEHKSATTTERPGESRTTEPGPSRPPTSTVRVYTDPSTGLKTITNAPQQWQTVAEGHLKDKTAVTSPSTTGTPQEDVP